MFKITTNIYFTFVVSNDTHEIVELLIPFSHSVFQTMQSFLQFMNKIFYLLYCKPSIDAYRFLLPSHHGEMSSSHLAIQDATFSQPLVPVQVKL